VLLLGLVAAYSLYTAVVGTSYTSCINDDCRPQLVPVPQALIPLVVSVVAGISVIARSFTVTWIALAVLAVFGFVTGFSIGGPIFVLSVATVPFVALYESSRAARLAAIALALGTAAIGLILALTTILGVVLVAAGVLVAFGVLRRVPFIAWTGFVLLAGLLVLSLPYSIAFMIALVPLALVLPRALAQPLPT
jgi:hypothetical protein